MIIYQVFKKNLISSLRGEYLDFIIGRITFTVVAMFTSLILYNINNNGVGSQFIRSTGSGNYLGFIIVGTAMYSTTNGILLNVARTLMTERREGTLESVLIIPFSRWKYYGGNQIHQLFVSLIDLIIAIVFGVIFKLSFSLHISNLLVGMLMFFINLYGLAMITSLIMIYFKDTFFIQNTMIPLVLIIGGYLFSVEVLPIPLKIVSDIFPIHVALDLIRSGTITNNPIILNLSILIKFIPGLVMLIGGYILLPSIERRAIEDYLS